MICSVAGLIMGMRFFRTGSLHSPSMNSCRFGIGIAMVFGVLIALRVLTVLSIRLSGRAFVFEQAPFFLVEVGSQTVR